MMFNSLDEELGTYVLSHKSVLSDYNSIQPMYIWMLDTHIYGAIPFMNNIDRILRAPFASLDSPFYFTSPQLPPLFYFYRATTFWTDELWGPTNSNHPSSSQNVRPKHFAMCVLTPNKFRWSAEKYQHQPTNKKNIYQHRSAHTLDMLYDASS